MFEALDHNSNVTIVELAAQALSYQSQDLTLVTAGCVVVAAPAVVFTFIIRKYMKTGLAAGAVKG